MFHISESQMEASDSVLRPDDAAAYLRVSLPTLMALIRSGDLRAARVGRQWRIRRGWLDDYLDRAVLAA